MYGNTNVSPLQFYFSIFLKGVKSYQGKRYIYAHSGVSNFGVMFFKVTQIREMLSTIYCIYKTVKMSLIQFNDIWYFEYNAGRKPLEPDTTR